MVSNVWEYCPHEMSEYLTNKLQMTFKYTPQLRPPQYDYCLESHLFMEQGYIYRICVNLEKHIFNLLFVQLGVEAFELIKTDNINLVKEKLMESVHENFYY